MHLAKMTGWYPWIPQDARDFDHTPYAHRQVEIAREEWDIPETVDPRSLDPMTNAVDLWWRPVAQDTPGRHHPYAQLRAQMSEDAQRQATARATQADMPDASPHEARRAYEAFMTIYAPELPAVWDALPARMQRAWGAVVDAVRRPHA